jgi:hypothetical protein
MDNSYTCFRIIVDDKIRHDEKVETVYLFKIWGYKIILVRKVYSDLCNIIQKKIYLLLKID